MSDHEPTRPLRPARVLPPPSLPPGHLRRPDWVRPSGPAPAPAPAHQQPPTQRPAPARPAPYPQPPYGQPHAQPQHAPYQQPPRPPHAPPPPAPHQSPYGQPHHQPYAAPQQTPYGQPYHQPHQQPQWQHGGYPQPGWQQPWAPPPRRRSGGKAAWAIVGVASVIFFALIMLSAFTGTMGSSGGRSDDDVAVDHSPARATNPDADPVDAADAEAVVEDNTLYQQGGLANGDCPSVDIGAASTEEQTAFYESLLSCLNDAWRPAIESAGYAYSEPGLVVFDSDLQTPCGNASPEDGRTLAFYCPTDEMLYADVPQMRKFFGENDVAYAIVIGHEFGHHVQNEIGVLDAFEDLTYNRFDDRLELNRRVELQASCMGGLFLGAVAESYPMTEDRVRQLSRVSGSFGDEPGADDGDRDHGSGGSNREWINSGFNDNDLAGCNTFAASSTDVD